MDPAGKIRLTASLADNTKLTQMVPVSKTGDWPLYIPLYAGQGFVLGWLSFVATPTNDLSGQVVWFKPGPSNTKFYPAGFSVEAMAEGSRYSPPTGGNSVLNFADAIVAFDGADLASAITNRITLGPNSRVKNHDNNKLTLTFKPATGAFSGRVANPTPPHSYTFNGVVLQKTQVGLGFFLSTTVSGGVMVAP